MSVRIRNYTHGLIRVGKGRRRRIARLRKDNLLFYSGLSLISITLTNLLVSYTFIHHIFIPHTSECSLLKVAMQS